jgi:hypothetical protein
MTTIMITIKSKTSEQEHYHVQMEKFVYNVYLYPDSKSKVMSWMGRKVHPRVREKILQYMRSDPALITEFKIA